MRVEELRQVLEEVAGPEPRPTSDDLARVRGIARRQQVRRRTLAAALAVLVVAAGVGAGVAIASGSSPERRIVSAGRPPTKAGGWHPVASPPFPNPIAAVTVNGRVIVAFGPGWLPAHMEFAAYDPTRNRWTKLPVPPTNLQAPFSDSPTFVWTGRELIVWGYQDGPSTDSFDGSMRAMGYDPVAATWRMLPRPPITGLIQAIPVWTGREMIVWGANVNGAEVPVQAAAYDPTRNVWRRLPAGPLHPREDPSAVWTGHEMIVWGGFPYPVDSADGAAFDPTTNTWRLLPPSGLTTRELGSVVWTGRALVVWSGSLAAGSEGSDGASYDPVTKRWQPIAPAPVAGRHFAATVWTGDRMIVWGGQSFASGRNTLGDGAAYDPRTNRWSPLPPSPLVSRWGPVSAFVDHEMLVLGGYGPSAPGQPSEPPVTDAAAYRPGEKR